MTMEPESEDSEKIWKEFLRKHWKAVALFVAGVILVFLDAILVYLWFVEKAQVTGLVPMTLNLWAMGHLVTFVLHVIFWEVLFTGAPVILVAVAVWQLWWEKFPDDEKERYRRGHLLSGTRSRSTNGGGGISFLILIAFIIKIYLDGNWNIPFATWTFDYLVYSCVKALLWVLIICGIPLAVGGTWWLHHEMKKNP
ncbi:MAG: hypothetical protein HXS41_11055 [Theionarchaea archaeon]|nr:hypothetical protein [Theionarchaea archaeon]MBU7000541.1 hypothetical protein [Theionarchaea archaeon]MBU7021584.1 hypothetical protein [Theionarchaea archaeon]MBU7039954.1 hypothetical protein [Theionarchaea archaeon]